MEKFVNDSLKGVIWKDDAQISWMFRSKTYVDDPVGSIEIYVAELGDGVIDYENICKIVKSKLRGIDGKT